MCPLCVLELLKQTGFLFAEQTPASNVNCCYITFILQRGSYRCRCRVRGKIHASGGKTKTNMVYNKLCVLNVIKVKIKEFKE